MPRERRRRARRGDAINFNHLLVDPPEPEIAGSASILGDARVGAGAVIAQGVVVRSHARSVDLGNHSAVLENGVTVGTPDHPVRVGQRTVFGHRATIVGATIGTCARSATERS